MRQLNIDLTYYTSIIKRMKDIHEGYIWNGDMKTHYVAFADQGVLGLAFAGYINFYDPDNLGPANTTYNFRPFVIEHNKQHISNAAQLSLQNLHPKIIHLLGNKPNTAPEKRKSLLKISQQCLQLWDKFEQKARNEME